MVEDTTADAERVERQRIRNVVEDWATFRDGGFWDRFADVWHDDGRMMATWFRGPAEEFIEVSRRGREGEGSILHFLGGSTVDVAGERAIAQTRMEIHQRDRVHGELVDVVCFGRFYDFFERRDGEWGVVLRQPIYEKDRMDVVAPGVDIELDQAVLDRFPDGYQHLAYLQTKLGFDVKADMPGLKGPEVESLYESGERWLAGEPLDR